MTNEPLNMQDLHLSAHDTFIIDSLAKRELLGTCPAEVAATLISMALRDLVDTEFVRKYVEMRRLL